MKDFLKTYKKNKIIGNLTIIGISLVLAIGINLFLIDGTNLGNNIKGSIIDSKINEEKADLYLEKNNNDIFIRNSKQMNNVENLSFSLNYNPEEVSLKITSETGNQTILENTPGIKSVILNLEGQNFNKNDLISTIKIITNKNSNNINLVNANFTDKEKNKFELSTSGITY